MNYIKYRLSEGVSGTHPLTAINATAGTKVVGASAQCDHDTGYRIGYLSDATADLTGLEDWDVSVLTESEALEFCRGIWEDVTVNDDGTFSSKECVLPFAGYTVED